MNGQMDRLVYYYCRFFGDGAFCEEHFGNLINYVPPPPFFSSSSFLRRVCGWVIEACSCDTSKYLAFYIYFGRSEGIRWKDRFVLVGGVGEC